MFHLLLLVDVMILDKIYFWKISTEDDIEKNKLFRSTAWLGRGFQTRPKFQIATSESEGIAIW